MFNRIKNWFTGFKKTAHIDEMLREHDAILLLIEQCYSMNDFVFCKKKIKRFENHWVKGDDSTFAARLARVLLVKYNRRLNKQRYHIGLYAEAKRKKKV